jgi:hypothetical protein
VLEWAQPAVVVGPVSQLSAGVVKGQDPQVVHVKSSEVAGDFVVECPFDATCLKSNRFCVNVRPWCGGNMELRGTSGGHVDMGPL